MMRLWLSVLSAALTVSLFWPQRAEACSGLACEPGGSVAPADGKQIPANVPAVVLSGSFAGAVEDRAPKLLDETRSVVASQISFEAGQWLIRPDAPLAPGETYTVTHDGLCGGEPEGDYESSFTTGAVAPLPTALGTLAVADEGISTIKVPAGGLCETEAFAAYRSWNFTAHPSVQPWLPVISWRLEVNGSQWASTPHGSMEKLHVTQQDLLLIYSLCDQAGAPEAKVGLAPGEHTVELQGFLPGATEPFAVVTEQVFLDCNGMSIDFGERDSLPPLGCAVVSTVLPGGFGLLALIRMLRARRRRAD